MENEIQEAIEQVKQAYIPDFSFNLNHFLIIPNGNNNTRDAIISAIEQQEKELRTMAWIEHLYEMVCTDCGSKWSYCDNDTERFKYCPNCGANCQPKGE